MDVMDDHYQNNYKKLSSNMPTRAFVIWISGNGCKPPIGGHEIFFLLLILLQVITWTKELEEKSKKNKKQKQTNKQTKLG